MSVTPEEIDQYLPQTQCTRCGYPRCLAYATALSRGESSINRCPPGGDATLQALAELLHRPVLPLDPSCGVHESRMRAVIDEQVCIGCRKCIDACPVDAIIGARKVMHTVIAGECNGCALCLPPCPVDCIALVPVPVEPDPGSRWTEYSRADTARWRARTQARLARLATRQPKRTRPHRSPPESERARIRAEIHAAVERVRARKRRP